MTAAHAEIVERLQAAKGCDPALGRDILLAFGWMKTSVGYFFGPLYYWSGPNRESFKDDDFYKHDPTASLDAAMKLAPADATTVETCREKTGNGWRHGAAIGLKWSYAASVPLAMCIAAIAAAGEKESREEKSK